MKTRINLNIIILLILAFFTLNTNIYGQDTDNTPPKYVFYFIGDGYGLAHAQLTEKYLEAIESDYQLVNTQLPITGIFTTNALNREITGSAAAGTALACGEKTNISRIGLDSSGAIPLTSIAEKARDNGMKVGIVTSVSIDHATPACFYAHQKLRSMYYEIAVDLTNSDFNYFAGGGFKDAYKYGDSANIYSLAINNNYNIINTTDGYNKLEKSDDNVIIISENLSGGAALNYSIDQQEDELTLADFTRKGIEYLDNPNGFFMMVEGGKIDWACHANDIGTTVQEVIDFDKAVAEAIEFYNLHPDETIIIVCADHETGGLGLGYTDTHYESYYSVIENQKISTEAFSVILEEYKENTENPSYNEVFALIQEYFGFDTNADHTQLSINEKKSLEDAYNLWMSGDIVEAKALYGYYNPIAINISRILSNKSGIGWTSFSHTSMPIVLRAIGNGTEIFYGSYDNTDVPKKMEKLMGIE